MDPSDSSNLSSSTTSSSDVAPRMRAQFENLSTVLAETSENLLSFEFMLQQYRQLAKIRPLVAKDVGDDVSRKKNEDQGSLEKLLTELKDAVGKVASLEAHLTQEEMQKPAVVQTMSAELSAAQLRVSTLENECQSKSELCEQLAQSAHRSRAALEEERQQRQVVEERLEREQRAARKVGEDIARYVQHMRSLEAEVEQLKKENKKRTRKKANVDMDGDTLTATVLENDCREEVVPKVLLDAEKARTQELESKLATCEEQIRDYERQLGELKGGLEGLQEDLESKCRLLSPPPSSHGENIVAMDENKEQTMKKLSAKTRSLLNKYRRQKSLVRDQSSRMAHAKEGLRSIIQAYNRSEENYLCILSHLGAEIEVCARLMAAYLGVKLFGDIGASIQLTGKPLSEWFSQVQVLSTWLKRQLVAFGKRAWTKHEVATTRSTAKSWMENEISAAEDKTLADSSSIMDMVHLQDHLRKTTIQGWEALEQELG